MSKPIEIVFSEKKPPSLNSPYLICGFPGTGLVGKLAVDYLIKQLGAIHMADLFSTYFSPQVVIQADGTTSIVKNSLYYVKNNKNNNNDDINKTRKNKKEIKDISKPKASFDQSNNHLPQSMDLSSLKPAPITSTTSTNISSNDPLSSKDLILLTGDSQPVVPGSEYVLSEQILDLITKFKISNIYSLASYVTGNFVNDPKIYGTATNPEMVKTFRSFNISTLDNGNITGMNGLILGLGKLRGIEGICLLGETSGYVIDAKASKHLLEILNNVLGIHINMDEMNKRSKDTELLIKNLEQQMMAKSGQFPQSVPTEEQEEELMFPQNRKSNMGYIS
ncbi:MAG TPA: PAC2 family protein [Nitrososphaeraceae archaeon]|nr:PAC2 family protein [Nitrososphaeraceae archaeon]